MIYCRQESQVWVQAFHEGREVNKDDGEKLFWFKADHDMSHQGTLKSNGGVRDPEGWIMKPTTR